VGGVGGGVGGGVVVPYVQLAGLDALRSGGGRAPYIILDDLRRGLPLLVVRAARAKVEAESSRTWRPAGRVATAERGWLDLAIARIPGIGVGQTALRREFQIISAIICGISLRNVCEDGGRTQ